MQKSTWFGLCTGLVVGGVLAGWALLYWADTSAGFEIGRMVPGLDGQPDRKAVAAGTAPVDLEGRFRTFDGKPGTHGGEWARFRGPDFSNTVAQPVPLVDGWAADRVEPLWTVELGEGHAGPAVWQGRVYVLDYLEKTHEDALRCFSLDDGREIWRRSYTSPMKRNHGFSRTVPAVAGGCVVSIGPTCKVLCADAVSGAFKWGTDLPAAYGTAIPFWYTGQCPLIDGKIVVLAPGGPDALMVALDLQTGKEVWRTPNEDGWKMSHSSIVPATLAGRRTYVYAAVGGIVGVAADGPTHGQALWRTSAWTAQVVAPSPVVGEDGLIFMTAGYGAGGALIRVTNDKGSFAADLLTAYGPKDGAACEQQTPILRGDVLYAVMPKDGGSLRRELVAVNPADPKKMLWTSGKSRRFGLGPYLMAGDKLFVLNDDGELFLYRVKGPECELLDSVKVLDGHDAWGPMALVEGWLLLRDDRRLVCIDVGKH